MVVVPVCRDDPPDARPGIDTNLFEVMQADRRLAIRANTRINNDPIAPSKMRDHALSKSRPKKGNLKFVRLRRGCWLGRGQGRKEMFPHPSWPGPRLQPTMRERVGSESPRIWKAARGLHA